MGSQVESGFVEVPGASLYYETIGNGPALLFVHAGIANLRMWDEQVAAFAPHYRVIRYDTRGFGRSRTLDGRDFSNRADLAAVLDHLGVERTHLVGCSRAGSITLNFALEYPARAESLVWVCGGVSGLEYTPTEADAPSLRQFEVIEQAFNAKEWERVNELETQIWVEGAGQPDGRADPTVRQRVLEMNRLNVIREDPDITEIAFDPPAAARLASSRLPILAIIGDLDTPDTFVAADFLVATVPGTRKIVFHGTAHVPNMEQPERFNAVLNEFLSDPRVSAN